ncbi:MAG: GIY-YIG nuclease family protein [Microscillaceae bacterium]|nr:GIY-YIG nuclease family protein [Microscillaceae bacterium]
MSNKKKISLDDIFSDDDFGLLDSTAKTSNTKSEDERLTEAFEEINVFVDKYSREPSTSSMSEYSLLARLRNIRQNEAHKITLKPFDRHNLLGEVEMPKISIDDILDDESGLLNTEGDLSIFKYKHIVEEGERAEAEFIAQRKPLTEEEFKPYEVLFQKVHQEIKEGKRKIKPFHNIEQNLKVGSFYFIDGLMLYLKSAETATKTRKLNSGDRERTDGRTFTIFENGTYSTMLFRSLGKQIQKSGKLITKTYEEMNSDLYIHSEIIKEDDIHTGWIYVLKSKSNHPEISKIENLFKIGFSKLPIDERIKNAKNEATYLYADVVKVLSYDCYNRSADKLEQLLHRFFAEACLNIDIEIISGKRIAPREWFIVPLEEIEKAVELILNGQILNYRYDRVMERIVSK